MPWLFLTKPTEVIMPEHARDVLRDRGRNLGYVCAGVAWYRQHGYYDSPKAYLSMNGRYRLVGGRYEPA